MGISLIGANGSLVRAFRTKDKSHGVVVSLSAGIILMVALTNLATHMLEAKRTIKESTKG